MDEFRARSPSPLNPTPEGTLLAFRDYLHALRRVWALILLLAVTGAVAGYAVGAVIPAKYASSATAFVSAQSAQSLGDLSSGTTFVQQAVKGYSTIATTSYVLTPVITGLGLDTTAQSLAGKITATAATDEAVLTVTATDSSPVGAARLANAVAKQLETAVIKLTPDAGTKNATSSVKLTVVDPAVAPTTTTNVSPLLLAGGGLLAGVVIAVLVGLLRELTDTRLRTPDDVARLTDLPMLGAIAEDPTASRRPLAFLGNGRSPRAEAMRGLRTNLRFVEFAAGTRSILVTSSIDGEGKSTSAADLALAAAELGQRVLLVDADLRRPRVDRLLSIDGGVGLSDVLIGEVGLKDAVQTLPQTNLDVLPAGTIPPNPNEQLQSRAMRELVATVHAEYDLVVFDTPPLLAVSDAAVLSELVGGVLVIAAAGRVRRAQLGNALAALERVGGRAIGVVMTRVPRRGADAFGYGYGYGVSETGEPAGKASRSAPRREQRNAW